MKNLNDIIFEKFKSLYSRLTDDKRETFFQQPETVVIQQLCREYTEQYISAASGIIVNSDLPEEKVNQWLAICVDYVDTEWFKNIKNNNNATDSSPL